MRFTSTNKPAAIPSWRVILWMTTLLPLMLMASWFARGSHAARSKDGASGLTKDEARRLDRILHFASDSSETPNVGESLRDSHSNSISDSHSNSVLSSTRNSVSDADSNADSNASRGAARLRSVSDNTFGIPVAERVAYEALLTQAHNAQAADLERAAHRDVPFALLMLEPDRFRGDLITIEGDLRRLLRIATVSDNAQNSEVSNKSDVSQKRAMSQPESYEAWIFTSDSGLNPYRVVYTDLPTGLAVSDQITPPIRVRTTGYFFKRFSYATTGSDHTAPLLLAKTLTNITSTRPIARLPDHRARTLTIASIGTLLVLTIGWLIVGGSVRQLRNRSELSSSLEPPDFQSFSNEGQRSEIKSQTTKDER
jgi:hypothetical protein